MPEVFIRKMIWSDVSEVLSIERMSFTTPWSETAFLKEIYSPYSITKIAVVEGEIAGYACASHLLDEGHILNLAIHPDLRRRGIATVLIRRVIEDLRINECRFLLLEVRASNHGAIEFYERFGFRSVGYRKDYYTLPKEGAVLMELGL